MTLSVAQLKMRRSGITATDLSAVLGENPWHKPIDVWLDKMGYTQLEKQSSEQSRMGQAFESAVAQHYKRTCCPGGKFWRIFQPTYTQRSKILSWALATPDRYVFEYEFDGSHEPYGKLPSLEGGAHHLLEVKLVGPRALDKWLLRDDEADVETDADRLPSYVFCQVQWQMFVTGYNRCDVAAQLGGTSFRKFEVARDDMFIANAIDTANRFWVDNVIGKKPPEPDGSPSYKKYLNGAYEQKGVELAPAPPEAEAMARCYKEYCDKKAEADRARETYAQKLKKLIGDGAGIQGDWGKATWTTAAGKADLTALVRDLDVPSETIDEYRQQVRTLRVHVKKG